VKSPVSASEPAERFYEALYKHDAPRKHTHHHASSFCTSTTTLQPHELIPLTLQYRNDV